MSQFHIEQGSPEWHALRCGKVTASRVADVIAKTKSGPSASRATYMGQLIAERLTGVVADSFKSEAMQWGNDTEADARAAYEFYTGNTVSEVGFVEHPTIKMSGASPDGLVGSDGLVEIKCPNTATHIETLLRPATQNKKFSKQDDAVTLLPVPQKYITQIQWQLECTGRNWCDFVSFDPRMPEHMRLFIWRVERDAFYAAGLRKDISEFLEELEAKVSALRTAYPEPTSQAAE